MLSVDCNESKENKFYKLMDGRDQTTVYGFHGSKPENFFSILQHGLVNNLNKRDVFGVGTYLSTEIEVALQFATPQRVSLEVKIFSKVWTSKLFIHIYICTIRHFLAIFFILKIYQRYLQTESL